MVGCGYGTLLLYLASQALYLLYHIHRFDLHRWICFEYGVVKF